MVRRMTSSVSGCRELSMKRLYRRRPIERWINTAQSRSVGFRASGGAATFFFSEAKKKFHHFRISYIFHKYRSRQNQDTCRLRSRLPFADTGGASVPSWISRELAGSKIFNVASPGADTRRDDARENTAATCPTVHDCPYACGMPSSCGLTHPARHHIALEQRSRLCKDNNGQDHGLARYPDCP